MSESLFWLALALVSILAAIGLAGTLDVKAKDRTAFFSWCDSAQIEPEVCSAMWRHQR